MPNNKLKTKWNELRMGKRSRLLPARTFVYFVNESIMYFSTNRSGSSLPNELNRWRDIQSPNMDRWNSGLIKIMEVVDTCSNQLDYCTPIVKVIAKNLLFFFSFPSKRSKSKSVECDVHHMNLWIPWERQVSYIRGTANFYYQVLPFDQKTVRSTHSVSSDKLH